MAEVERPSFEQTLVRSWLQRGWLAWVLWPVSLLFGVLVHLRRWLYRLKIFKAHTIDVPVVVVGNVVAGGSGKTPAVIALVKHLQAHGMNPGVVSRGYGRGRTDKARDCQEVHLTSSPADVGDEPLLIKCAVSNQRHFAPVFVAIDRVHAALSLLVAYPQTDVIICDDGLQHLALQHDISICVFDDRGVGNGFLLPAGPLREPWPRAVDLVLHSGDKPAFAKGYRATRLLGDLAWQRDDTTATLDELAARSKTSGHRLIAVAAIAQPEAFFSMLRARGLPLAETIALPDHYDFSSWKPIPIKGYTLICTEKDAVKLWAHEPHAWAVPLIFKPEASFLTAFDGLLEALPAKLSSRHGHSTT